MWRRWRVWYRNMCPTRNWRATSAPSCPSTFQEKVLPSLRSVHSNVRNASGEVWSVVNITKPNSHDAACMCLVFGRFSSRVFFFVASVLCGNFISISRICLLTWKRTRVCWASQALVLQSQPWRKFLWSEFKIPVVGFRNLSFWKEEKTSSFCLTEQGLWFFFCRVGESTDDTLEEKLKKGTAEHEAQAVDMDQRGMQILKRRYCFLSLLGEYLLVSLNYNRNLFGGACLRSVVFRKWEFSRNCCVQWSTIEKCWHHQCVPQDSVIRVWWAVVTLNRFRILWEAQTICFCFPILNTLCLCPCGVAMFRVAFCYLWCFECQ